MKIIVTTLLLFITQVVFSQEFKALCNAGINDITNRNYKEAKENFRKATEISSNDKEKIYSFANLAYSQQMCGELEDALKSYNTAIGLDKEEITLIQQRANIYMMLDSTEKALDDYNYIIEKYHFLAKIILI